jgi:hypothetical protein
VITETNKTSQFLGKKTILTEKDILAIELKFKGKSLKEVSEIIEVPYGTVRSWFMTYGRLFNAYKMYSNREIEYIREESKALFRGHLKASVGVLIDLLGSKDPKIRFQVAKEIISRELGDARKVSAYDSYHNPARDILLMAGLLEDSGQEDLI